MLGRSAAQGVVDEVLTGASSSRSRVLVIEGDAGMGKTAMCRYAADRARALGFREIAATGAQWESDFELATLSQLLRPLGDVISRLPERRREILEAAVGLGEFQALDRHSLAIATLDCLATAAEEQPLLVLIDDTHWVDQLSAGVLGFALRRLDADAVAVVLAGRGERRPFDGPWPRLPLDPLPAEAVAELVHELRPDLRAPTPAAIAALTHATAGNPLALHELAPLLRPPMMAGTAPLPHPIPLTPQGRASIGTALETFPERTRLALGVVAIAGSQPQLVEAALARLELGPDDLAPARDAGVLADATLPAFTHPLRQAAANDSLPVSVRRTIHGILADLTPLTSPDRSARHLDASGAAPDVVADAMQQAAEYVARHAGRAAAGTLWARAAELTADPALKHERMLRAASALALFGDYTAADRLLVELLDQPLRPSLASEALVLRAQVARWTRHVDVLGELVRWRDKLTQRDPSAAAQVGIIASGTARDYGLLTRAHELAQESIELAAGASPLLERIAELTAIYSGIAAQGSAYVPRRIADTPIEDVVSAYSAYAGLDYVPAHGAQWQESFSYARELAERFSTDARSNQALGLLPDMLLVQAEVAWWTGDWSRAYAYAGEGRTLAEQLGQVQMRGFGLGVEAAIFASMGRRAECEQTTRTALNELTDEASGPVRIYALRALGLLELGTGNLPTAVAHLETVHQMVTAVGLVEPTVVPYLGDLTEALTRSGEVARAREVLVDFEASTKRSTSRWAGAVLLRCQAMLDPDADDAEPQLRESIEILTTESPMPFERARTLLALGQLLRRQRRTAPAREALREAAATFSRLGAEPWLAAAESERRAAGDRDGGSRTDRPTLSSILTSQQLQVCLQVAAGATNREVASALFLSPKTVDYHLRRAFLALGIRSRVELARLVAEQRADPGH